MFASLRKTVATLFGRDFVGLLFWVLVASAVAFVALIVGLEYAITQLPASVPVWLKALLEVAAPLALLFAVLALGAPVAALVGSLFLDRIAAKGGCAVLSQRSQGAGRALPRRYRRAREADRNWRC
ncbi:MAG: EI24 domain-containing protein [Rhizomicrobium sp.]